MTIRNQWLETGHLQSKANPINHGVFVLKLWRIICYNVTTFKAQTTHCNLKGVIMGNQQLPILTFSGY